MAKYTTYVMVCFNPFAASPFGHTSKGNAGNISIILSKNENCVKMNWRHCLVVKEPQKHALEYYEMNLKDLRKS